MSCDPVMLIRLETMAWKWKFNTGKMCSEWNTLLFNTPRVLMSRFLEERKLIQWFHHHFNYVIQIYFIRPWVTLNNGWIMPLRSNKNWFHYSLWKLFVSVGRSRVSLFPGKFFLVDISWNPGLVLLYTVML